MYDKKLLKPLLKGIRCAFISLIAGLCLGACQEQHTYKSKSGLEYTLFSEGKDSLAHMGAIVKIHYIQQAGDSIIENTYEKLPIYYQVMASQENQYNPLEVFDYGMRKGDSLVIVQQVDSMYKKGIIEDMPQWLNPGDTWTTYLKVVDVFTDDLSQQADRIVEIRKAIKRQQEQGMERIQTYLHEAKIAGAKKDSLYVEVLQLGEGRLPGDTASLSLRYRFSTLQGFVLVDTVGTKAQIIRMGTGYIPKVLEDQIKEYPIGSHLRVYLPQALLYGVESPSQEVDLDDDWIIELKY